MPVYEYMNVLFEYSQIDAMPAIYVQAEGNQRTYGLAPDPNAVYPIYINDIQLFFAEVMERIAELYMGNNHQFPNPPLQIGVLGSTYYLTSLPHFAE